MATASDEQIADPQLEQEPQARDRAEVLEKEEREEEHAEADFEEEYSPEAATHFQQMVTLIGGIFRGDDVELEEQTELSADERLALEVLTEVVRGKDQRDERILYAEERLAMLNHALAVLQPTLAMALTPELAAARDQYDALVEDVTDLRDQLERLDSAQEEIFEQDREAFVEAGEPGDTDDKPDGEEEKPEGGGGGAAGGVPANVTARKEDDKKGLLDFFRRKKEKAAAKPAEPSAPDDPDAPRRSTLYGEPDEPAVEKPQTKSTLGGDD